MTFIRCQHLPRTHLCLSRALHLCAQCFDDHILQLAPHETCGPSSRQAAALQSSIVLSQIHSVLWRCGLSKDEQYQLQSQIHSLTRDLVANIHALEDHLLVNLYQGIANRLSLLAGLKVDSQLQALSQSVPGQLQSEDSLVALQSIYQRLVEQRETLLSSRNFNDDGPYFAMKLFCDKLCKNSANLYHELKSQFVRSMTRVRERVEDIAVPEKSVESLAALFRSLKSEPAKQAQGIELLRHKVNQLQANKLIEEGLELTLCDSVEQLLPTEPGKRGIRLCQSQGVICVAGGGPVSIIETRRDSRRLQLRDSFKFTLAEGAQFWDIAHTVAVGQFEWEPWVRPSAAISRVELARCKLRCQEDESL